VLHYVTWFFSEVVYALECRIAPTTGCFHDAKYLRCLALLVVTIRIDFAKFESTFTERNSV